MKKNFLYTALGLIGIMGALSIGVVNADVSVGEPYGDIEYDLNGNEHFKAQVITITGNDGTVITILDRNLGATIAGTGCDYSTNGNAYCAYDDTYGYHFQRGNNYGFKPGCGGSAYSCEDPITSSAVQGKVDATTIKYNPSNQQYYTSGVFYKQGNGGNNRLTDNGKVDLWGGGATDSTDTTYNLSDDTWKVNPNTVTSRQGPCPKGFHVPSRGELDKLTNLMGNSASDIRTKLLIPFAGYRSRINAEVEALGRYTYRWSSSPYISAFSSPSSRYLYRAVDGVPNMTLSNDRAYGQSIRCFYNEYAEYVAPAPLTFTLTFTGSGQGSISTGSIEVESGSSISRDDEAGSITISGTVVAGIANEGHIFSGWLTDCAGPTVTAACSFTGEFKPITYTVEFTGTDVSGTMNNQDFTYGVAQNLTGNAFTKTGYEFSGWTYGTTGYADGQEVSNLTTTNNDIITFTAQWTPITYTIDFSGNATNVSGTQTPINAEYDSGDIAPESSFTLTGYTFTGWNTESDGSGTGYATGATLKNLTTTGWATVTLYAQWKANKYTVTFDVNGGNALTPNTGAVTYDTGYGTLPTPSRNGYSFNGWFTAATNGTKITATTVVSATGDHTLYAQWTQNPISGGSSSGGGSSGGGGSSKAKTSNDSTKSTDSQTGSKVDSSTKTTDNEDNTQDSSAKASEGQNQGKTYSDEFQQAYEFAYKHGITTMPTIEQANMEGPLTRIAMAKMLSYYAINVLGLKPDETRVNKFKDVSDQMDAEYNNAVTLAYQLGIMGINMPKNKFRPNDLVTRAEFATALSRMLYKIADGKDKYYSTHMAKLMEEKIITNDNPNLQELRGYVMIMLMRSAK